MDCLFCAIIAGVIPSKKVYEDEVAYAFLDINPWHPGHTLVIPKKHCVDLLDDPTALTTIAPAITVVAQKLMDDLDADGFNTMINTKAVSGQEVFHLHVHVIPRYDRNPGMAGLMNKDASVSIDEVFEKLTS